MASVFKVLGFSQYFSLNWYKEHKTAESPTLESVPRAFQIIKANSYFILLTNRTRFKFKAIFLYIHLKATNTGRGEKQGRRLPAAVEISRHWVLEDTSKGVLEEFTSSTGRSHNIMVFFFYLSTRS